MAFLSQASHPGSLLLSHYALQEYAAHPAEWSAALNSNGSDRTCIRSGLATFLHCAFTTHSDFVVDWCSTPVAVSHVRDGPSGQEACSDDWARWPSHAITLAPRPCMPGGRSARGRCRVIAS